MAQSLEDRVDFVEGELIAAGDIDQRLKNARAAFQLVHRILEDLVGQHPDAASFADDMDSLDIIARSI